MRYLYLGFLLAFIALGATALESADASAGTALSIIKEGGAGPYLVAWPLICVFVLIGSPGTVVSFLRLYGKYVANGVQGLIGMFAFGLAVVLLLSAVLAIAGHAGWGEDAAAKPEVFLLAIASATLAAFAVSVPEELLFRGFILGYLRWSRSAVPTIGAVLTSALIFAVAHNLDDPLAWLTPDDLPLLVGLFLLGLLLAISYLVTRSLWCPIGLHAALVFFNLAILQSDVIAIDLSAWWLGGTDDIREAPVLWLAFVAASFALIVLRKRFRYRFAIETPFVGSLLSEHDVRVSAASTEPQWLSELPANSGTSFTMPTTAQVKQR